MSDDDDLTRLEDLSEFLHTEDSEVDDKLKKVDSDKSVSLSDLDNSEEIEEVDVLAPDSDFADEDTQPDLETNSPDIEDEDGQSDFEAESSDPESNNQIEETETESEFDSIETDFESDSNEEETESTSSDNEEADSTPDSENFDEIKEEEETDFGDSNIEQENIEGSLEEQMEAETTSPPISRDHAPSQQAKKTHIKKENFSDIKSFANNITYGSLAGEGAPPYSILINNIEYKEDAQDIQSILQEHGLLTESNKADIEQGVNNGSLLISQISEFSAIYLGHKFRRLSVNLQIGLSEEIHESKSFENEQNGMVTKDNLLQNKEISADAINSNIELKDIILSTTQSLQGYDIIRYIDIVTEMHFLTQDQLELLTNQSDTMNEDAQEETELEDHPKETQENSIDKIFKLDTVHNQIYQQLTNKLKEHALKQNGNAVIGINFQIQPLSDILEDRTKTYYKITCTGNIVQISNINKE